MCDFTALKEPMFEFGNACQSPLKVLSVKWSSIFRVKAHSKSRSSSENFSTRGVGFSI